MKGILPYTFIGFAFTLAGWLGFSRIDSSAEQLNLTASDKSWVNQFQVSNLGDISLDFKCPQSSSSKCSTIVNSLPRGDPTFDPLWGSTYLKAHADALKMKREANDDNQSSDDNLSSDGGSSSPSDDATSLTVLKTKKPDLNALRLGQPMLRVIIVKLAKVIQITAVIAAIGAVATVTSDDEEKTSRWLFVWGGSAVMVCLMHLTYALACARGMIDHVKEIEYLLSYKSGVIQDEMGIEFEDIEIFKPFLLNDKIWIRFIWAIVWILAAFAVALAYRKVHKDNSATRNVADATESVLNDDEVAQQLLAD